MKQTASEAGGNTTVTAAALMNPTTASSLVHEKGSIAAIPITGKVIGVTANKNKINNGVICLDDSIGNGDSDILDDDDDTKGNYEGLNSGTTRNITLQTLMSANVLQPGKSVMTIEYMGQKFVGDLLPDGRIKSQETETVFVTPSAWAMNCKRIINPEKKSGSGWGSVKYKGKKLDVYKNSWLRKCALQKDTSLENVENDNNKKPESPLPMVKRLVYQHNTIINRNVKHDATMLIQAVPFTTVGKLQPFLLTMRSSALLLADFHCHLTMEEVCGYLGGTWDVNTHTLVITKAYPCRNSRFDRSKAAEVEQEIQKTMNKDQLLLVGWYHSHPKFQAEPTLKDCDAQLAHQIRMRGPSDATYTPCVALIISPYYDENPTLESVVKSIWIMPPNENKQALEYGRPMLMQYSVLPDKEIPEEVRTEIQSCVDYYSQFHNEIVRFSCIFSDDVTYIEKLKNTLYPKFPVKQNDKALWNWICAVLGCEQEDDFIPPKTIKIIDSKYDTLPKPITEAKIEIKTQDQIKPIDVDEVSSRPLSTTEKSIRISEEQSQNEQKASELKVLSLQEQLCLPSGLNMNPVRMLSPLATPNPTASVAVPPGITTGMSPAVAPPLIGSTLGNATNLLPSATNLLPPTTTPVVTAIPSLPFVSPRDSPITITSSSVSPAKLELPIRASPSPAKSSTSPHTSRTRKSPAPSSGKFSISDITRNSPSITPTNKYDANVIGFLPPPSPSSAALQSVPNANDLMAASLAQLAGQLPSSFLQSDLAALFQQRKDYGNTSLNQLATTTAKAAGTGVGGGGGTIGVNNRISGINSNQKQLQNSYASNIISSTRGSGISTVSGTTDFTDPQMVAASNAYSPSFNMPRIQEMPQPQPSTSSQNKSKSDRSSKYSSSSSSYTSSASSSNSYKTKLMKELDELKNDPLKMSELIRSPEYAALLLQQAEALGATTLGSLGFGTDFNYLTAATGLGSTSSTNNKSKNTMSAAAAAANAAAVSAAALTADYNNLIQASKLLGYDSYLQHSKNNDLNAFLQQQMAAAAAASIAAPQPPLPSNTKKQQQQQQQHQQTVHPDYTILLQTYSKLFDPNNQFGSLLPSKPGANNPDLSAFLSPGVGSIGSLSGTNNSAASSSTAKQKPKEVQQQLSAQTDMLNQLLQSEKQQSDLNALLYHQNKAAADLNAMFATSSAAPQSSGGAGRVGGSSSTPVSNSGSTGTPSLLTDPAAAYYTALAQEKIQDYAAFIQQQQAGKYGIPDPLSKSTLAANNMFMSPSALLKIQQESLSAMMMKPPKSIPSHRSRESSASPASERLTPTKSNVGANCTTVGSSSSIPGGGGVGKYNFSAVDLAISSVSSNTPSPVPPDGNNSSMHRRPTNTPPVDLSRLYGDMVPPSSLAALNAGISAVDLGISSMNVGTKKRMEFSSIADLAAPPPPKIPKSGNDILNLSNE